MLITQYLVECDWSLRDRPTTHRWHGRNGTMTIGDADHGVPYGQDYLLILYIAYLAIQNNDTEISGSIDDIPAFYSTDWRPGTTVERLSRVSYCTYQHAKPHRTAPTRRSWLIDHLRMGNDEYSLRLSDAFMLDLEDGAPASTDVVRALSRNLGALTLYLWQIWNHHHEIAQDITLFAPGSPFRMGNGRNARTKVRQIAHERQTLIHEYWPECPYAISNDTLQYRPTHSTRSPPPLKPPPGPD